MLAIPEVLRNKSVVYILFSRVMSTMAYQMISVAVGWQIYSLTNSTFYLGLVGLMQFLPMIMLTLIVGHVADSYDRRFIAGICQISQCVAIFLLAAGSFTGSLTKEKILLIIFLMGIAHAFEGPATQSLLPNLVSKELFPKAAALAASSFQTAVIIGPALGGLLYSIGPAAVYMVSGIMLLISAVSIFQIIKSERKSSTEKVSLKSLLAGISFIKSKPIILGAISLDLFAVLLGGATALLPAYAKSILFIGPIGLGVLRSAPAVGALVMSAYLARKPLKNRVGYKMFTAVFIFGVGTIVFALSRSFVLSLVSLIVMGGADVISVVVRSTLVQMQTPDHMRGRVSSVNMMFIGTSNQLGEFESGVTASLFGLVPAAVIGGIGTIIVVALWMTLFPGLARVNNLGASESA